MEKFRQSEDRKEDMTLPSDGHGSTTGYFGGSIRCGSDMAEDEDLMRRFAVDARRRRSEKTRDHGTMCESLALKKIS